MNARELHDAIKDRGMVAALSTFGGPETILRALDLLARVEESEDELVQSLHFMSLVHMMDPRNRAVIGQAAAALVALKAERDDARKALASWHEGRRPDAIDKEMAALVKLDEVEAERDRLRAHAEAMAGFVIDNPMDKETYRTLVDLVDAYRRDFPKDAP